MFCIAMHIVLNSAQYEADNTPPLLDSESSS